MDDQRERLRAMKCLEIDCAEYIAEQGKAYPRDMEIVGTVYDTQGEPLASIYQCPRCKRIGIAQN